jgi:hypothetical protein
LPVSYEERVARAARARDAQQHNAAVRAADDPKELARVARIFKVALARGRIDRDGNVIEPEQADS